MEKERLEKYRALGRHFTRQGPGSGPSQGGFRHPSCSRPPRFWLLPPLLSAGDFVSPDRGSHVGLN